MHIPIANDYAMTCNQIVVITTDEHGEFTVHVLKDRYGAHDVKGKISGCLSLLKMLFKIFVINPGRVLEHEDTAKLDLKLKDEV